MDPKEREKLLPSPFKDATEETSTNKVMAAFVILIWGLNNMLVTLVNKAAFAKVDFKFPYTLSAIHIACNIVGAQIYFWCVRSAKPKHLDHSYRKSIALFSTIFTLNIAIGNMSLRWVTVNFNQICRALIPALVMGISIMYYGKTFSASRKWAVVPICIGVGLAFYGDVSTSFLGAVYTFLCVFMGALKAVASGELLTGDLKLHPIDLLTKMCPLALFQCLFLALVQGELWDIMNRWDDIASSPAPKVVLLSGFLSFFLNVSSFTANKYTSPLTLSIAAGVKQVLLVLCGTLYFQDEVPFINGIGILIVLAGSFRYAIISTNEK